MSKTTTKTTVRFLLVVLAVLAATVTPAVAAAETTTTPPEARDARLAIEQPSYVDGDVSRESLNGNATYVVKGERQLIKPTNFNAIDVVDFGVQEDAGTLSYSDDMGVFEFSGGQQGTYHLHWTVRERYAVENESTNTTETDTRRVRYEALIRVSGETGLVHMSQAERDRLEENADLGATVNATMSEIRAMSLPLVDNTGSDKELFEKTASLYVTYGKPLSWLSGSFTQLMLLIALSPGGWLLVALVLIGFGGALYRARKKANVFETTESDEGTVRERHAELDQKERTQSAQNLNWTDFFDDPHTADAFEKLGRTPKDGVTKLLKTGISPEVWIRDRLQAMHLAGWTARVERDPQPDGGDDDDDETAGDIVSATLLSPDTDLDEIDGETVSIDDEIDALADVLDWTSEELVEFDLVNADIEWDALDTKPVTMDASELPEELGMQFDRLDDQTVASQYLLEFVESVHQHRFTDSDGDPETVREILNDWLHATQYFGDVAKLPGTMVARQHLQRALADYDENEEARKFSEEVRSGAI